jgi:NAD(P)-dependent dehydrogenase (short-subunit alcohol dehydrogenase family)
MDGRIVMVTGAGHPNGIGAGIGRCFAARGARVVITDLPNAPIHEAIERIGEGTASYIADAADQSAMREVVRQVVAKEGRLDVLINNAGIGGPTQEFEEVGAGSAFMSMSDSGWDMNLTANLKTAFSSSHAAIPHLTDGGSIVNIASIAALGPTKNLPAYGAAKAGVVHLTKTLAMELAPRRIRVNCICPGLLYTRAWELLTEQMKKNQPEYANMSNRQIFEAVVASLTPLGGEQTPEDIGNLAMFFASDDARMITGQVVAVDGGISVT